MIFCILCYYFFEFEFGYSFVKEIGYDFDIN